MTAGGGTPQGAPTVVVIEDEASFAGALSLALPAKSSVRVVGVGTTLAEGVGLVRAHQPDLVLCDYRLPDGDASDRIAEMLESAPGTKVAVFTSWAAENSLVRSLDAGATGYFEKSESFDDLVDGLRRVLRGEHVLPPKMIHLLAQRAGQHGGDRLTPRELSVLDLVAKGHSNAEIASELHLSAHTIRNYVTRLYRKLGVSSRLAAANAARERGLIRPQGPTG